ncbi:nucleoside-diphosphate kinase [Actinacidiphila glaucinigra]|nr:nucleoside-diphosphate kinase [Actinacidiphila glaucinigra]
MITDQVRSPVIKKPASNKSYPVYHDIPHAALVRLTRSFTKAELYSVDNYFREGLWTFSDDLDDVLGVTLGILKPEAAPGRRYHTALQALIENGFLPVDAMRFRHDRLTIRETWRYQMNVASRERIATMDIMLPAADSILMVLKDLRWRPGQTPASVRLTSLKGPSDPAQRDAHHLRRRLGAVNRQLNFLHTSDEPIDVIRELSVLCPAERRELVKARIRSGHDASAELRETFAEIEQSVPAHDLDLEKSWERLAESKAPAGFLARERSQGRDIKAEEVITAARHPSADHRDLWDLISIMTHTVECNTPGVGRIFPNIELSAWESGPADGNPALT